MMGQHSQRCRRQLIEGLLRPAGIADDALLEVMARLPREDFVPPAYQRLAYADVSLPIGHGQVTIPPLLAALLLQQLAVAAGARVLEVGTGRGYMTACLALLLGSGGFLCSVEYHQVLRLAAYQALVGHRLRPTLEQGDAATGWQHNGERFDGILIGAAVDAIPPAYRDALAVGGRLVTIRRQADQALMQAVVLHRASESSWFESPLFETELPPLLHQKEQDVAPWWC